MKRRYSPFYPQLVVGLLFLTAIASLAVTLGEDFGPGNENVSRNATVFYVNPVLFAVSWVNITDFVEAHLVPNTNPSSVISEFLFAS